MGEFAHAIPTEMLLAQKFGRSSSGPSPDIMALKGRRMVYGSEIDENQAFSSARIKGLTGKDEMVGRNPHAAYQTNFFPTHKLFLMTNTQPEAPAIGQSVLVPDGIDSIRHFLCEPRTPGGARTTCDPRPG